MKFLCCEFNLQESYSRWVFYFAALQQTGNYNMLDGRLNNEPPERPDLTDGQTYGEIRELAPETLPEETPEKPSLMERLKAERSEHEAKQAAPLMAERER